MHVLGQRVKKICERSIRGGHKTYANFLVSIKEVREESRWINQLKPESNLHLNRIECSNVKKINNAHEWIKRHRTSRRPTVKADTHVIKIDATQLSTRLKGNYHGWFPIKLEMKKNKRKD